MSSVTEMRGIVRFSTVKSHSCPSAGGLGEGNTPFPNPFEQLSGISTSAGYGASTNTSIRTLETIYEIPAEKKQQHTLRPSNGFLLQRQNCIKETNDD